MNLVRRTRLAAVLAVVAFACVLNGCGGGDPAAQQFASEPPSPSPTPTPGPTPSPTPTPTPTPSTPPSGLSIATAELPIGMLQQPYAATLDANGNTGAVQWSVLSGALPAGVTLASDTGALTGTPTASGVFNVSIQAADGSSTVSRAFSIHVSGNGTYYHRYTKPGTYNVRIVTTDAAGNTATATQTITVK